MNAHAASAATLSPVDFIHRLKPAQLPDAVRRQAGALLLDLVGCAAAGARTDTARILRNYAARQLCSVEGGARLLFDGRRASPAGAAWAGAALIDSYDAHDGHVLTKGHAGVTVLPTLLALADSGGGMEAGEFMASFVLGYEIATRAGIALHATACDYHTSGAWNALAAAALVARHLKLDAARTREALGIAEYHGPRSPMMRCIAFPTMVKDGSGMGAFAGVSAGFLAADGFTGAPAATAEGPEVAEFWGDLGSRWRILEQYVKAYPVCRWAQPAVEAALSLRQTHGFSHRDIARLEIHTFREAVRLATPAPRDTDAAQYSTPFPVAAALVRGRLGAEEVTESGLGDPDILALSRSIVLTEHPDFARRFPAERLAIVSIALNDGRRLESAPAVARGGPENPLDDAEIETKFAAATGYLGRSRQATIRAAVGAVATGEDGVGPLLDGVLAA